MKTNNLFFTPGNGRITAINFLIKIHGYPGFKMDSLFLTLTVIDLFIQARAKPDFSAGIFARQFVERFPASATPEAVRELANYFAEEEETPLLFVEDKSLNALIVHDFQDVLFHTAELSSKK